MDIVERLRDKAFKSCGPTMEAVHKQDIRWQAADEIERLRNENQELTKIYKDAEKGWRRSDVAFLKLREALQKIAYGNVDRESAKKWRTDGQYSKNDRCSHEHFMYEECAYCISDFALAALKETE